VARLGSHGLDPQVWLGEVGYERARIGLAGSCRRGEVGTEWWGPERQARPGRVRKGPVWHGVAGKAGFVRVRYGEELQVRRDAVRRGPVRHGRARSCRFGAVRWGLVGTGSDWRGTAG
jgi:hypothetical protein